MEHFANLHQMKIYVEQYTEENELYARVDEVVKKNNLYHITDLGKGFKIVIWQPPAYKIFVVERGLAGKPFDFVSGTLVNGRTVSMELKKGDVLILYAEYWGQVWFYFPKLLIGKRETIGGAMGFTTYGSVFNMLRVGLITDLTNPHNVHLMNAYL